MSIKVWNELGSEERSLTVVVKRLRMLGIVLMIIGGVILFCFVVLVMTRIILINRNKHSISKKTLERKQQLI